MSIKFPDTDAVRKYARHDKEVFSCAEKFCTYKVTLLPSKRNKNHPCPSLGGLTVIRSWGLMPLSETEAEKAQHAGKSLLQMLWEELDEVTEHIITGKEAELDEVSMAQLRGEAVGLAKAIVIFHRPFFDEGVKAVSKEALVRYKAKKAGEEYQTIGIAERKYEMAEASKYTPENRRPVAVADPVLAEVQKISDSHKATIRKAPQDAAALSKLFGCSVAAIERIRG